jgi:hypothetical protein
MPPMTRDVQATASITNLRTDPGHRSNQRGVSVFNLTASLSFQALQLLTTLMSSKYANRLLRNAKRSRR